MAEAISRRLLIRDFGAGWAVRLWFSDNVRCLQITEMPRYKTRRLGQTAGGIVHEDAESERLFEAPDAATRQLLAEEGRRLQSEIGALRDRRKSLLGQRRGWRFLCKRLNSALHRELSASLDEVERRLHVSERQRAALCREQVGFEPLPDQIAHYGRLPLGASIWVLDWSDSVAGCPIFEYIVVAETIDLRCRSDEVSDATTIFRYAADPAGARATWPGAIMIEMRRSGAAIPAPYGLSAYHDLADASRERLSHVQDGQAERNQPQGSSEAAKLLPGGDEAVNGSA